MARPLRTLLRSSRPALAAPVKAVVDALASAVEPLVAPITDAVQPFGAPLVSRFLGSRGPAIHALIDPISSAIEPTFDRIAALVEALRPVFRAQLAACLPRLVGGFGRVGARVPAQAQHCGRHGGYQKESSRRIDHLGPLLKFTFIPIQPGGRALVALLPGKFHACAAEVRPDRGLSHSVAARPKQVQASPVELARSTREIEHVRVAALAGTEDVDLALHFVERR